MRFVPIAQVSGTVLGLDAQWLDVRSWTVLCVLALGALVAASVSAPQSPLWLRLLAVPSVIGGVVLTTLGHELGHVLFSRLNGLAVRAVILAPQGGVTIRGASHAPVVDIMAGLGGPLANLVLGGVCVVALLACGPGQSVSVFLVHLALLQVATAAANLLPWGPMDGRRIMAAWRARG